MSFVYRGNAGFGGLDHRRAASDGAIYDMRNLSARDLPVLTSRKKRVTVAKELSELSCAIYVDRLFYVADGAFFDEGERMLALSADLPKKLCHFQNKILIMPDGILYDVEKKEAEYVRRRYEGEVQFLKTNLSLHGEDAIWLATSLVLQDPDSEDPARKGWEVGQYLHIKASFSAAPWVSDRLTDYTLDRICKITDRCLARNHTDAFDMSTYEYIYKLEGIEYSDLGNNLRVTTEAEIFADIPDMDVVFESGNRLWGAHDGEIFCSALGQADVWFDYDTLSTSAWRVALAAGDKVEGGCVVAGMPCFFSENAIYKVYGDDPTDFSYARSRYLGIKRGEGASLCAVGERAFYVSKRGVCAYAGGAPSVISDALGSEEISHAIGGTDGVRYYLYAAVGEEEPFLYVFDADKGVWVKEDGLQIAAMYSHDGEAACLGQNGDILILSSDKLEGDLEDKVPWLLETADYTQGAVIRKVANRLLLRYELGHGAGATVCISYEGEAPRELCKLAPGGKQVVDIPLPPTPHDHFKIVIWGEGEVAIYALEVNVKLMAERK